MLIKTLHMKTIGSPTLFLIFAVHLVMSISVISFSGCNNTVTNSINTNIYQARSEQDFVANSDLRARQGTVIAVNLEAWFSSPNDTVPDTGVRGEDLIPFRYTENAVHRIRMESSSRFNISFVDKVSGELIYYIDPVNNYVTLNIAAGDYIMHINSWDNYGLDSSSIPQTLFIQPEPDELNMVISSVGCPNCDLSQANLKHMSFPLMNFSGANLNKADLGHTNLLGTNFSNTNLDGAYFYQAYMPYADLSYSSMQNVVLRSTNLDHANVGASDLTNADLRFADISYTNFCGSTLTGVITNGIFWNAPPQCWP